MSEFLFRSSRDPRAHRRASAPRCCRDSPPTADSTCRCVAAPHAGRLRRRPAAGRSGRATARAVPRRRSARHGARGDGKRGFQFPGAARAADGRRAARGAGALSRPDGCVQGLRRALPGGVLRAAAPRRGAAAHHPGRDLRRHRRGGRRGLPRAAGDRGRGAVPQGAGVADAGAPADLLGRQRALARGARHVR